jgi:hypothetical protein
VDCAVVQGRRGVGQVGTGRDLNGEMLSFASVIP